MKREGRQASRRPYFARLDARVSVRCRRARVIPTYMSRRSSSTVSSAIERWWGSSPSSTPTR